MKSIIYLNNIIKGNSMILKWISIKRFYEIFLLILNKHHSPIAKMKGFYFLFQYVMIFYLVILNSLNEWYFFKGLCY